MAPVVRPRPSAVVVAALAALGALMVPRSAVSADPCHLATLTLRVVSSEPDLLYLLDFTLDPTPAGARFLLRDGQLECEFLQDGCSGCPSGGAAPVEGSDKVSFSADGGFEVIYPGSGLFRCYLATDGTLPTPAELPIEVTSAMSRDGFSLVPATVTMEVSSLTCGAACPEWPRTGCRSAGSSSLRIDPWKRRQLSWKWKRGDALAFGDLADPGADGHYTACVYPYDLRDTGYPKFVEERRLPLSTGWKTVGSRGYLYRDVDHERGPLSRLKIKSGPAGRPSVSLRIDDPREDYPPATGVTIQLFEPAADICWESRYSGYEPDPFVFEGTTGE